MHVKRNQPAAILWLVAIATVTSAAWAAWYLTIGMDDVVRLRYVDRYFGASATRTVDGRFIPAKELGNSDYCGHCHTEIFHQWDASTHHFSSFNDPYYRRVALDVAARRGPEALKFCAGCHDPLPLLSGEMPLDNLETWSGNAGITCLSCHRVVELHGRGNGGYSVSPPTLHPFALTDRPFMQQAHKLLVKLTPFLHKKVLLKPFYSSSEYCVGCHTVRIPGAINGAAELVVQDESSHGEQGVPAGHAPAQTGTCQGCHMPLVRSDDPAAHDGFIHSHRFVGGNTAIPTLNRDTNQLQAAISMLENGIVKIAIEGVTVSDGCDKHDARRCERYADLAIRISNPGVGHAFPGGTADSNEAWVQIGVRDALEATLFTSGTATAGQELPPGTYTLAARYVDRHGVRTNRRTTSTEAVSLEATTVLEPKEERVLHYNFPVPAGTSFPLAIEARLNWRKFSPGFSEWVFEGRAVEPPPVTLLGRAEASFPQSAVHQESDHVTPITAVVDSAVSPGLRR
jgi:hypothetical protein